VQEAVSKEVLEILDEAEKVKATDEKTYGELLNDGELDGVRPN